MTDVPQDQPQQQAGVITSEQAARLLMISAERVRQLTKEGWIVRLDRDRYRIVDVVQGYLRFRNDADRRVSKNSAESRIRDARAEEIQLRVALRVGELIEHSEHVAIVEELCGLVRSELSGLPARLTRDLAERRRIERAVNEILERLAACAEANAKLASAHSAAMAAVTANDAGSVGEREPDVS